MDAAARRAEREESAQSAGKCTVECSSFRRKRFRSNFEVGRRGIEEERAREKGRGGGGLARALSRT